jgi:OmpA-OmpF porin, OOP family
MCNPLRNLRLQHAIPLFLAGWILIIWQPVDAQNLVSNPGFEQFRVCPEVANTNLVSNYQLIPRWFTVSAASPDYFNACSKNSTVGVPKNFAGNLNPRTGNGYMGLILKADSVYYHGSPNYTEHIQNRLTTTLKKDRYYCFEIWLCLGRNSTLAAQDFGVYFSRDQITFPNPPDTLPLPHIEFQKDQYLNITTKWIPLRGVYKAQGGEKYLTMGNFRPWKTERFQRIRRSFGPEDLREFAYYLFDDVSLVEVKDPAKCDCNMVTMEIIPEVVSVVKKIEILEEPVNEMEQVNVGESFVLENIFFDFDKSDLLPESFEELDNLVALMRKFPAMTIEIAGHTDYKGSVEYNKKLSDDRARSVVNYLASKGIDQKRLTSIGYGKAHPIADNTTEEGRQINRRVEFKVLTK